MRMLFLFLLSISFSYAVDPSLEGLAGAWRADINAEVEYLLVIDVHRAEPIMILRYSPKNIAVEDIECGPVQLVENHLILSRTVAGKIVGKRDFEVLSLVGDTLSLKWDNPPIAGGMKFSRIMRDLSENSR